MTFSQYYRFVTVYPCPKWSRLGQYYFNSLPNNMARKLQAETPELDPYHDDRKIGAFLDWAAKNWEN